MAWLWTALSVVVFVYLLRVLLSLNKKKRLPPGPRGLPVLGHLHLLGKKPHEDLFRLARKHGPIMYLCFGSIPTIVVSSPAAAELFLKTHDLVFASRPPNQASKYLSYDQKGLIFAPYGPYWRNMRKLSTLEMMSNVRINQFEPMRKAELELLVSSIKQAALAREPVNLSSRVLGLTVDMTCLMAFGRKYSEKDLDNKQGFKAMITDAMALGAAFNLIDYFPYLGALDLQGLTHQLKTLGKSFDVFFEKIINDHAFHKQEGKKQITLDFVDVMMSIMESGEAGFEFDRCHVKALLLDIFVAGTDTSATAVEWTLSELLRHPTIMEKVQKELEAVVGMNNMVEESHLDQLEYLGFVIKEVLRLHPVGPFLLPRESIEDCVVVGFDIPKKSRVLVNIYAIGRDPNVWSNPEAFSPERFIGSNTDLKGCNFELIPFGAGRRGCPGMQLGLKMVQLMVAQLVHCFYWELPNGMRPDELDMSEHFGLAMCRAKHLMVIPTYRLNK